MNGNGKADLSALINKSKQEALKISSAGLAKMLEEGNRNGKLDIKKPKYFARILIAGINALIEDGEISDEEIITMISDIIQRSGKDDENV